MEKCRGYADQRIKPHTIADDVQLRNEYKQYNTAKLNTRSVADSIEAAIRGFEQKPCST